MITDRSNAAVGLSKSIPEFTSAEEEDHSIENYQSSDDSYEEFYIQNVKRNPKNYICSFRGDSEIIMNFC